MVVLEFLFLIGMTACAYMRSQQPDLFGLEKFMDYGFVKSILRSTYMPAADMWLAGSTINYYYFGQYICAAMSILTGTAADASYNMMLAVICGECVILSYSLGAGIYKLSRDARSPHSYKGLFIAGLISMMLLTFGGNLHSFFYGYAFPLAEKAGLKPAAAHTYFYPDSTRFIGYNPDNDDKTITEFPSYSFVVADLHGHVSDIPQALLLLGFALAFGLRSFKGIELNIPSEHGPNSEKPIYKGHTPPKALAASRGLKPWRAKDTHKRKRISAFDAFIHEAMSNSYSIGLPLISGALLGTMFMTNAWDFPIYLTVTVILILFSCIRYGCSNAPANYKKANLMNGLISIGVVVLTAVAVITPFSASFENFSKGIGLVHRHSPLWQLFMLWGHFWILTLPFFVISLYKLWHYFFKEKDPIRKEDRFHEYSGGRLLLLLLICCGYGLLLIPEVVYVKDIYEAGYHRANTMFKVTYQAFIILSVCCGPAFVSSFVSLRRRFATENGRSPLAYGACTVILIFGFLCPMLFLFKAVPGYYNSLKPSHMSGLGGTRFIDTRYQNDRKIIDWLNANVQGQPVILEAPGQSYSNSARISAMTGLPTVIGWNVHEWLWRNSSSLPTEREAEVSAIYLGYDKAKRAELLKKYNVKYIVISDLEKEKYPDIISSGILRIGKIVVLSGKSILLELP